MMPHPRNLSCDSTTKEGLTGGKRKYPLRWQLRQRILYIVP